MEYATYEPFKWTILPFDLGPVAPYEGVPRIVRDRAPKRKRNVDATPDVPKRNATWIEKFLGIREMKIMRGEYTIRIERNEFLDATFTHVTWPDRYYQGCRLDGEIVPDIRAYITQYFPNTRVSFERNEAWGDLGHTYRFKVESLVSKL